MEREKHFDHYLLQQTELKIGRYVFLNVYHLSKFNQCLKLMGLGLFHTSIEIDEIEYSYGSTDDDFSGIYINKKSDSNNNLVFKEKILLGLTIHSETQILSLLHLHSDFWLGKSYDPFKKNCNDFTKFMAGLIIKNHVCKYPLYINRITEFGFFFYCFHSPIKILFGDLVVANNEQVTIQLYNKKNNKMKKSNLDFSNENIKGIYPNNDHNNDDKDSVFDVDCEEKNNKNNTNFSNINNKLNLSKLINLRNLSQVQINLQEAYGVLDSYKDNVNLFSEKGRHINDPLETNKIDDIHLDIQIKNMQNNNLLLRSRRKNNIVSSRQHMEDQVKIINKSDLQKENLRTRSAFSMTNFITDKKGFFSKNEKESVTEIRALTSNVNENEEKELVYKNNKTKETNNKDNVKIKNKIIFVVEDADKISTQKGLNSP